MSDTQSRKTLFLGLALGVIALIAGSQLYLASRNAPPPAPPIPGLLWPNPKPVPEFGLTDQHGQPFTLARLKGHWTFLFFGYTHCPDVCPITLAVMNAVDGLLDASPGLAEATQFAFVSVDPARDTPEQLAKYVAYFNPDFIGATGSEEAIHDLTRRLGVVYMRGEPDAQGDYTVDHSASILLVDPEGRFVAVFGAPHDAKQIAERFRAIRDFVAG